VQLDLRKVAHFVAVVEEGSMTRAAVRLRLTQQALSMSVRALERELGVALLARGGGGITLLPAGTTLFADAGPLLEAADAAVGRSRQADRPEAEVLRIGHTPDVTGAEVVAMLAGVPPTFAATTTQVTPFLPADLRERLWNRSIDLGLARAMSRTDGLGTQVVTRHRLRVAVRAGHHLALREVLTLPDIARETLLVSAPAGESGDTDLLLDLCRSAGVEPSHRASPVQGMPLVTAVLGTDAVALVTDAPGPAVGGAVRVVELEPAPTVPLLATWRRDARSRARDLLVKAQAS
jgi:DNA-binding transcriptional LysR family regulator